MGILEETVECEHFRRALGRYNHLGGSQPRFPKQLRGADIERFAKAGRFIEPRSACHCRVVKIDRAFGGWRDCSRRYQTRQGEGEDGDESGRIHFERDSAVNTGGRESAEMRVGETRESVL